MSANVAALVAPAASSVCLVCTAKHRGAPLCFDCVVALADAVPPIADYDVETESSRDVVRRAVASVLGRVRFAALVEERGDP